MVENSEVLNRFKRDWCGDLGLAICRGASLTASLYD